MNGELLLHVGIGVVLEGVAGVCFWFGTKARKTAGLIEDLPTTSIGDLRGGLVEVKGRVRSLGRSLQSPLTGKPCVYYEFLVEERQTSHRGSGSSSTTSERWRNRVKDRQKVPCEVDDGSGSVRVDLGKAELLLHEDTGGRSGFLNDPSPAFEAAMARYGERTTGLFMNKTLRYRETYVEEGDSLYVLGHHRGGQITKGPDGVLVVSDKGEAGALDDVKSKALWFTIGAGVAAVVGVAWVVVALVMNH